MVLTELGGRQHTTPETAIEAFDEAVLHRSSRLNEIQCDVLAFSPFRQRQNDEFRAAVQAKLCWIAAPRSNSLRGLDDLCSRRV